MSRKQFFIIVAFLVLVGFFAVFVLSKQKPAPSKPVEKILVTPTPTPINFLTWTDEAGFSFQYPEGSTVDKHPEDTVNYANLSLTLPSQDTVTIKMSDNTYKDLDTWVGESPSLDVTLDDHPAKKIMKDGQEEIACIDNGVIVTIAGNNLSSLVNSWKFIYPTPSVSKSANTSAGSEDADVLEEE